MPTLFADSKVRTDYKGRVLHLSVLQKVNERQQKDLLNLISATDNAGKVAGMAEISLPLKVRRKKNVEAAITRKDSLILLLKDLSEVVQENRPAEDLIKILGEKDQQVSFTGFKQLNVGQQLIFIETGKIRIIENEINNLKILSTAAEESPVVSNRSKGK